MAFIEERDDELGEVEEEEEEEGVEKKSAMEVREEVGIGHPFSFLPPSSSFSSTTTSSSSPSFQHHHYFTPPPVFDASSGGGETSTRSSGEREHMFEKVVTPSDVGKLNRLVIPKQHAERYFPLDLSANEKGLLLSFEDRSGKPWRFRYSYWNSSQSYVMTKGWSRFVKEKKLDAGDVVSFDRFGSCSGTGNERFFIDWRRRPDVVLDASLRGLPVQYHHRPAPWGRLFFPPMISPRVYTNHMHLNYGYYCLRPPPPIAGGGGDGGAPPAVFESVPVAHGKAAAAGKRVRLFGVNLEQCTSGEEISSTSSNAIATSATASLLPLLPSPQQLRLCGGDDSTAQEEFQRKGQPSLSLDLDI